MLVTQLLLCNFLMSKKRIDVPNLMSHILSVSCGLCCVNFNVILNVCYITVLYYILSIILYKYVNIQ